MDGFETNRGVLIMAAQIDGEIARLLDEAHQRVRQILAGRRPVLDDLARLLSQKESVQGEDLRQMLAAAASPSPSVAPYQANAATASVVLGLHLYGRTLEKPHET